MKLQAPVNTNYAATVVAIKNIIPLTGCDNVVGTTIHGFQAIIGKDVQVGTLGIVFPAETQLSEAYVVNNNLYRHNDYNKDKTLKGYLEDNRRVKAIKFRGHTSNCLFMPLSSLSFVSEDFEKLTEGDTFDKILETEICKKYVVPTNERPGTAPLAKKFCRVDKLYLPEHFSTDNYFRNDRNIPEEQDIIVTQKLHGTSIRIAHTIVTRKLSRRDKLASLFGVKVQLTEYDYVYGSKRVIKDANNPDQKHYYDTDIWTTAGKALVGSIPENFLVYGELIGWTADGKAIQSGYTYNVPDMECRLYIYRIAFVNDKGFVVDLSWDQVKEFCVQRNLLHVPELWRGKHKDLGVQQYLDTQYFTKFANAVTLPGDTVDEGICVRVDKLTPQIYKAKSPKFFEHETKLMDKGELDMESAVA